MLVTAQQFFCLSHDVTLEEYDFGPLYGKRICPCIKVLPMGFNWNFYLVQILHEQAALEALSQQRSSVFLDDHPSTIFFQSMIVVLCRVATMFM